MKLAKVTDTHFGFDCRTHKIYRKFLKNLSHVCEKEGVEALLHCGDWATNNQLQIKKSWKMFREFLGDLPIYTVMGNHDFWDDDSYGTSLRVRCFKTDWMQGKPLGAMRLDWEKWAGEYDIFLLEEHGPIIKPEKNIAIYGFNGWYNEIPPNTNDGRIMPRTFESAPIHSYLNWQASKKMDEALIDAAEIKVKYPDIKTILLTHFPSYGFQKQWHYMLANQRWMDFLAEEFHFYCVGHSHRYEDFIYKSPDNYYMRCINAGSNGKRTDEDDNSYNKPHYVIFDTEEQWDLSKAITL